MTKEETLKELEKHLRTEGQRLTTTNSNLGQAKQFLTWLDKEKINYLEVNYTDLLAYIKHEKKKRLKTLTITLKINAIRHLYNCFQVLKLIDYNPTETLRLKGRINRQPNNLVEWEELETVYQNYPTSNLTGKRNKAILGMMIYQGLNSGEVGKLELIDVKLEEGKIYIPSVGRSNSRTLKLESFQILQLQKYITIIRPVIMQIRGEENGSERLFVSTGTGDRLGNSLMRLMKKIKGINSKISSPSQIRASVITYWLKTYNIREVQYKAGHRYLSSTERYRVDLLESLQEQIEELHPLK